MPPKLTVLSQAMLSKGINSSRFVNCSRCKKKIPVGTNIVTKKSSCVKWYHEECAKTLNII